MSIGLYIDLAPLYLKYAGKLQEKRFDFIEILAIIIAENRGKVSIIECFNLISRHYINYGHNVLGDNMYKTFPALDKYPLQVGHMSLFHTISL